MAPSRRMKRRTAGRTPWAVSTSASVLDQRIRMLGLTAIAGLPQSKRYHAAASFSGLALDRLVAVMHAWIGGLSLDQTSFAARFFNRPPDSPVVQHLHQAAAIIADLTTRTQMREATDQLATGMMAVGLDQWVGFLSKAYSSVVDHGITSSSNGAPGRVIAQSSNVGTDRSTVALSKLPAATPTPPKNGQVMSANQPGEGEGPTPELLAELRALRTDVLQNRGLNAKEADVAVKASEVLRSSAFQELRAARAAGTSAEIRIDGVTVVYEPSIPEGISGMALFGEKGFIMGPSAFRSGPETARTVLQELYR